jgi:hypothetical protein
VEERVRTAVADAYTKEGNESSVNGDLLLLRRNKITSLKQWASLSEESKKKYQDKLRDILDDASLPQGMLLDL